MKVGSRLGTLALVNLLSASTAAQLVNEPPLRPGLWWAMVCAVIVGTLGQSLFAGLEIGLYTVNRVRLRVRSSRKEKPDLAARLLAGEVALLPQVLPALLIGYNVAGAVGSYGLTALLTDRGGWAMGQWALLLVNLVVVTPVMFFVADMLPKELFRADADRLMYSAAWVVRGWRLLLLYTGVLPAVMWLSHGLARVLVKRPGSVGSGESVEGEIEQTRAHIHALLKEGANHGVMSEAQLTLVDRAFGLRENDVSDEMIPWSRCHVIQRSWTREAVLAYIQKHPYSRFPVADGSRLIGVIEHVDICLSGLEGSGGKPVEQLMKPAVRLAASVPVRDAMKRLMSEGERMAVVVEGGRPIGLVTMKDLVEPLTGELRAW
ncbi:MAG TPA: CNNM domain-containing protein [Phycisphaerales bacterium]|nr:CNNM domain-containing protein [Phycisphaerales bacterium]